MYSPMVGTHRLTNTALREHSSPGSLLCKLSLHLCLHVSNRLVAIKLGDPTNVLMFFNNRVVYILSKGRKYKSPGFLKNLGMLVIFLLKDSGKPHLSGLPSGWSSQVYSLHSLQDSPFFPPAWPISWHVAAVPEVPCK